mgnify:CR=1 FL=1
MRVGSPLRAASAGRLAIWAVVAAAVAFALVWILFAAHGTAFGSAVHDPKSFYRTFLDGLYLSSLYFVVSAGFTLIFGLMRVVNMAYGSFFLLGGYVAMRLQRDFMSIGPDDAAPSVSTWANWVLPLLVAVMCMAILGLLMQQLFLRWNQGQELRQALITIALSIVLADQMLAHFGGVAKQIAWPGDLQDFQSVGGGVLYSNARLFIIGVALLVGLLLFLWLKKTRMGMIIRAGVDDRRMVAALGINVQWAFAIVFVVGSGLAALGGVLGGSQNSLAPGVDSNWLLYSLVVVIVGGMGSLQGAALGSLIFGMAGNFAPSYLPTNTTFYAIIVTFVVLAMVLAVRPYGFFGRPE